MTPDITPIWNDFHRELKAFIYNKTRNHADTDDILQDVFVKIMRHMDKVSQSGNMRQYLYGIVRNAVNDHFRHSKKRAADAEVPEQLSETETESLNETIAECCIKPFVARLPEPYREALLVTEFRNVSQKELAEQLGISYSGAKSRVQRGREKLKEMILDCCTFESDRYGNLTGSAAGNCGCS